MPPILGMEELLLYPLQSTRTTDMSVITTLPRREIRPAGYKRSRQNIITHIIVNHSIHHYAYVIFIPKNEWTFPKKSDLFLPKTFKAVIPEELFE